MAKMKTVVEMDRDEVVKVLTDYASEKAGRPQGSSSIEFLFGDHLPNDNPEVEYVEVTFFGVLPKK